MDQEELLAALRGGDAEAIQQLVDAHGDKLLRSAFLLCGNEEDARDLVQDTFVQAIGSVHRFQGRSAIYTWLHSILLNLVRHHRRDGARIVYNSELAHSDTATVDDAPMPMDETAAAEQLAEAVNALSQAHREVVVLRYYEELKIHEIATRLGVSTGTVKSRLHYAVAELQARLPADVNLYGQSGTKERR